MSKENILGKLASLCQEVLADWGGREVVKSTIDLGICLDSVKTNCKKLLSTFFYLDL